MTFADYRGRYVGCNPVEVGAAAEDIIGEREALLREALVAISNLLDDGDLTDRKAAFVVIEKINKLGIT